MKLLRLKIDQEYKSLNRFADTFNQAGIGYDHIAPICFVGLNGSGKSNIIEALSEILCFLDLYHLLFLKTPKWALQSPLSFEVEYVLNQNTNQEHHILIKSRKSGAPELFEKDGTGQFISLSNSKLGSALPSRILGYSSGHNETISFPF